MRWQIRFNSSLYYFKNRYLNNWSIKLWIAWWWVIWNSNFKSNQIIRQRSYLFRISSTFQRLEFSYSLTCHVRMYEKSSGLLCNKNIFNQSWWIIFKQIDILKYRTHGKSYYNLWLAIFKSVQYTQSYKFNWMWIKSTYSNCTW